MYRIAICDDEPIYLNSLYSATHDILVSHNIAHDIMAYNNCEKILHELEQTPEYFDILLLDILMGKNNGMEMAAHIRSKKNDVPIVFVTSSKEYALEGYHVNALHYLLKPVNKELLATVLLEHYATISNKKSILLPIQGYQTKIPIDDIIFLESVDRKTMVHAVNTSYLCTGSLSKTEKILPETPFFRCHQGYIINLDNVHTINRYEVTMNNGKVLAVSRSFAKELQAAFLHHVSSSNE